MQCLREKKCAWVKRPDFFPTFWRTSFNKNLTRTSKSELCFVQTHNPVCLVVVAGHVNNLLVSVVFFSRRLPWPRTTTSKTKTTPTRITLTVCFNILPGEKEDEQDHHHQQNKQTKNNHDKKKKKMLAYFLSASWQVFSASDLRCK